MSLEEVIRENTAALNRLVSALGAMPSPTAGSPAQSEPAPGKEVVDEKPEEAPTLTYEADVRAPFLTLLNSNRAAAMKVLEDLGVKNLKGFEDQPETFADLAARINGAQNG